MRTIVSPKLLSILVLSLSCLLPSGLAQAPAGACGSQPYCVETNDFVATITSFRTSTTISISKFKLSQLKKQQQKTQQQNQQQVQQQVSPPGEKRALHWKIA